MLTCNCPRCGETIGLPTAAVPADATAQCPWCGELYPASEIIDKLPPMVELISADGQPLFLDAGDGAANMSLHAAAPIAASSAASSLAPQAQTDSINETWDDNTELTIEADESGFGFDSSEDDEAEQNDLGFDDGSQDDPETMDFLSRDDAADAALGASDSGGAPLMPMKVKSVPVSNYKRKKSSPIKTLIGVAMGPLVALPLAGGILLWLGKAPDLGFWPFDGSFNKGSSSRVSAEPMAQSSPINGDDGFAASGPILTGSEMMVPAVQPSDELDNANEELANLGSDSNATDSTDLTSGGFDMPSLGTSLKPSSDDSGSELSTDEVTYPAEPTVPSQAELDASSNSLRQDIAADKVPMEMPEAALDDVSGKMESILSDDSSADVSPAEDVSVKEEPVPDSVTETVEDTPTTDVEAEAEPSKVEASVAKANKLLASLMKFEGAEADRRRLLANAYASVSAVATEPNAGDSPEVQRLLNALSRSPLIKDLGDAANLWLDYPKRTTEGVLIIGKPESSEAGPVLQISSSSSESRDVPVSGTTLPDAEKVIALGRIVEASDGPTVELIAVESVNP
ncbi:hypothetical protein SH528x_004915 [Novipirellula sp. SH528]|uniref:hypothetical protein n=1 Tax=Novipirellula sp. SH528 TaxID=3454466 RepID=UPI003F9ED4FD